MYKYFTDNAREIMTLSKKTTKQTDFKKIKATTIVESILKKDGCYGKNIITSLDPKLKKAAISKLKNGSDLTAADLILQAVEFAYISHSNLVGTEHLIQAFIELELPVNSLSQPNSKKAKKRSTKLTQKKNSNKKNSGNSNRPSHQSPEDIQSELSNILNELLPDNMMRGNKGNSIDTYCTDLTNSIRNNQPLIGKKDELSRLAHILGRKNKNNPILIGDPGVGKTAIVEGLAQKINSFDVPHYLINKKILLLDLGQLVAGTTFRGEFEARLKDIMQTVEKDGNIILFIDEIHTLMGAGNAPGGMDAANILKPAMARGDIQIIGATTIDEYKKHIVKDAALERRLQPLTVKEATREETVSILKGIKKHYEEYHQVSFTDEALEQSAILAEKYITNRFLPDSAIDIIDEAAAKKRSQIKNGSLIKKHHLRKKQLEELIDAKNKLVIDSQYEKALEVKQDEEKLTKQLQKEDILIRKLQKQEKISVTEQDIIETLSVITGISLDLLSKHNSSLVNKISQILKTNLIGQPAIKKNINTTIMRRLSGLSRTTGPLGSFLFIGPTGVGKTMTAKLLAEAISPNNKPSLIQINMSEFTEKHSLSRLLGAPAGYIGHEESGEFSDKILRNPFSIVLFDEIEKADPSILNVLLQILEEGEIVDTKGKTINFRNTLVVLTSNIGTSKLDSINTLGFDSPVKDATSEKKAVQKTILTELKRRLAPELLARLDSTLIFDNLESKEISKIITKSLKTLEDLLKKRGTTLTISKSVVELLTKKSLAKKQGARLVRRNIQNLIEAPIAEELLKNKPKTAIALDVVNNTISITKYCLYF